LSIAAINPPTVVYREEQNFAWWVYGLLALIVVMGGTFLAWHGQAAPWQGLWIEVPAVLALSMAMPAILVVGVLRMTTEVTPGGCCVWFGWIPTYRRVVSLEAIQRVEVVQIPPFANFSGGRVRSGRDGERVLCARGNRGVRLHLLDGSRLLIGSQRPEELARVVEHAIRPAG